jgi:hypothetical protein
MTKKAPTLIKPPNKWKDKVEIKEDVNINVFPSAETLNAISQKTLAEAAERFKFVMGDTGYYFE